MIHYFIVQTLKITRNQYCTAYTRPVTLSTKAENEMAAEAHASQRVIYVTPRDYKFITPLTFVSAATF